NDPRIACQNDNLVAINSCIQVDLYGQVAADMLGMRQFSGTGGQIDFVRSANMSRGGRAIIAMPSTAAKGTISRIVPFLDHGAAVTTGRNDVSYIVTEYGVASLRGKTIRERAEALIGIAHPAFRDELRRQWSER
ncbi:MAG: acetyl-CoA hydrolase/transferase C-terminal domain-containing protein, partial [Oscillospiraceae bacterium]